MRHERIAGSQTNRPGGMTGKAAQNVTGWVKNPVAPAFATRRARRRAVSVQLAIPTLGFLAIVFGVDSGDEGDRLIAGAEGPVAWLRRFGPRQRAGVGACRLSLEFRRVTFFAGSRSRVAGGRYSSEEKREHKQRHNHSL